MLKRKIALIMLAIPLGMSVLAKSASAAEFNSARDARAAVVADRARAPQNRQQPVRQEAARRPTVRRVWVVGHWEGTARGRHWVPGHYETRR